VLIGTVRRNASHVRVTAQLLRTADGSQMWSETFERETVDLLDAQDDLAAGVARAMQISVDSQILHAGRPATPEAYDLYLKGMHAADQISESSTGEAIAAFQQALTLDPKFAAAATELARAYSWMGQQAWILPKDAFSKARRAADTAIRLDPKVAAPHVVMASILRIYDWDWDAAEREIAAAFALAPKESAGLGEAACLAAAKGDFDTARSLVRQALVLDPLSPYQWGTLGSVELGAGNFSAAETAMRTAVRIAPKGGTLHYWLGLAILMQHRYPDALAAFQQETLLDGQIEGTAMVYHALGRTSESDLATTAATQQDSEVWSSAIARVHAFRGETDLTVKWLQRAYEQRDEDLWMIKGDPVFARLSADPRFKSLLRRMNLPE
jgi:serine/threonine-protein kinase